MSIQAPEVTAEPNPIGSSCVKCVVGSLTALEYVRAASEGVPRASCFNCPPEEHLHVSCNRCGYTVRTATSQPVPVSGEPAQQQSQN